MSEAQNQDKAHPDMAAAATFDSDSNSQALHGRVTGLGRPPESRQSFVEGLKYGAAGGVAGAFAKSCTAPLARLTILYQVRGFSGAAGNAAPPKLRQALMQVVQQEGPAALWKGNLATILHRLPYSAINFYTYEHMNKLLRRKLPPRTDFVRQLSSGAAAGLIACSAAYPLDLVRTRLAAQTQGQYYHGIWPTLRTIVADEGVRGLYRGLGATLLQVVPSLALSFSLYDTIRNSCMKVFQRTDRQQHPTAMAAAAARFLGWDPQQPARHSSSSDATTTTTTSSSSSSSDDATFSSSGDATSSSSSSGGSLSPRSAESRAHSLSVASSIDQGTSHSQVLLWHLDDDDCETQGGLQRASAAAATASNAYSNASRAAAGGAAVAAAGAAGGPVVAAGAPPAAGVNVPAGISLVSGCVSGFLTATATFPLDVIRRRMQVHGRHHRAAASYRQIIKQITQQYGGLRGFYVGILPEYCKVVPGVAIAFCTYEQLKMWLNVR